MPEIVSGTKGTGTVGTGGGLKWLSNPFLPGGSAATFVLRFEVAMAAYTAGFAKEVENYAKENAPWEDRSGDARAGLKAEGRQRLTSYTIVLYHTVDYGIWLEVRWDGRYAIIVPTIVHMGHELMDRMDFVVVMAEG